MIIGIMVVQPESAVSGVRKSCEKIWNDGISARIGALGYERVFLVRRIGMMVLGLDPINPTNRNPSRHKNK